jgi:acetolactate synthase-1/2/3 large subunit
VVAIASQIPTDVLGKGRGYLHELLTSLASFAPIVKSATRAGAPQRSSELLAEAWRIAQTPPSGPVFVEIPTDSSPTRPTPRCLISTGASAAHRAAEARIAEAVGLHTARRLAIWAGGGVLRSGA